MRALSIRQPFAELILRGIKTIEYRSQRTHIIGERFWIYASRGKAGTFKRPAVTRADNIVVPTEPLPTWMVEIAQQLKMLPPDANLPTGVIVGSAVIENVTGGGDSLYEWHLSGVERARELKKPSGHPQPVWFRPF